MVDMLMPRRLALLILAVAAFAHCANPAGTGGPDSGQCGDACGGCGSDADCAAGFHCDPARRLCVACLRDDHCPAGNTCALASNTCAPAPNSCSANRPCSPDAGTCELDAGQCVECAADADCVNPANPVCDLARHRCMPGCRDDRDCPAPDAGTTVHCNPTSHQCVECDKNEDCPLGTICDANKCRPGCAPGRACTAPLVCCGTTCIDLTSDVANCGACDLACLGGWSCCFATCHNPASDVVNCGGCGKVCNLPFAVPACLNRACAVASCESGHANCNQSPADGCEVDTGNDPLNCGDCNVRCQLFQSTAKCAAGKCAIDFCAAPYGDCNKMPGDGCEADTSTSVAHCGGCGAPCSANHVTATCAAGQCTGACEPGWVDCNNDKRGDGCEKQAASDVNNCGGCGAVCSANHIVRACNNGACTGTCDAGYSDCDMNKQSNGCETATGTDPNNCGVCGRVCSSKNLTLSCAGGVCDGACTPGHADCNGNKQTDGCETDINDLMNCGGCNKPCTIANGTGACVAGACKVAACTGAFKDCNNDPADGCESNTATDGKNCGACGAVCATGLCGSSIAAGMLIPPVNWKWNGAAVYDGPGSAGVLTPATNSVAGTLIYQNPIVTDTFDAAFDFRIGGGTGADGMAFFFQETGNAYVGPIGGGLGVSGANGYAVEMDEYANMACGDTIYGHIAVDSLSQCGGTLPTHLALNGNLPFALHNGGWHTCNVKLDNAGTLTVTCDGSLLLNAVPLPQYAKGRNYYFGFGGGTGGQNDRHEVRNVTVGFLSPRCL